MFTFYMKITTYINNRAKLGSRQSADIIIPYSINCYFWEQERPWKLYVSLREDDPNAKTNGMLLHSPYEAINQNVEKDAHLK